MTITAKDCQIKYGDPWTEKFMVLWDVPSELEFGTIPNKIYCNKDLIKPLELALRNVQNRNLSHEIITWDGCFNIRKKRSATSMSLHSWGIAIDINAAWNGFGRKPNMSSNLVKCFTDAGFTWGGTWTKPDGMHFQLSRI